MLLGNKLKYIASMGNKLKHMHSLGNKMNTLNNIKSYMVNRSKPIQKKSILER
jgi:hypothetical protein